MVKLTPDGIRALESYKELLLEVQRTLDEVTVGAVAA